MNNYRAVEVLNPVYSADEAESTSSDGLVVMESVDYSLDSVVEVLDAVASDRCWRDGQSRVKFRSLMLFVPYYCAGGEGSSVAAPNFLFTLALAGALSDLPDPVAGPCPW